MMLFPNQIDKKFKASNAPFLPFELPNYFYKKRYTEFFKKTGLFSALSSEIVNQVTEEKLKNFVQYYQNCDSYIDMTILPCFDETFLRLIQQGYSIDLCKLLVQEKFQIVFQNLDLLQKTFDSSFLENDMNFSLVQILLQSHEGLDFLKNETITKEQKEFLITKYGSSLTLFLSSFDPMLLYQYPKYISKLQNYQKQPYFETLKQTFLTIEDKDQFFENIEFLQKKFHSNSLQPILQAYFLHPDQIDALKTFPGAYGIDSSFLRNLFLNRDNPIFRNLLCNILQERNMLDSFMDQLFVPLEQMVLEFSKLPKDHEFLKKHQNVISLLKMYPGSSLEEKEAIFQKLLDLSFSLSEFLNDFFDCTVIEQMRQDIFNGNDFNRYPQSNVIYNGKNIRIITIDDYPFSLLVSGIESKGQFEASFGTNEISQSIVGHPELWMDPTVKGSNMISMSRISESSFESWGDGPENNKVICGFSTLRKNQIVSSAMSDANTSMDVRDISIQSEVERSVMQLPDFEKRSYPTLVPSYNRYEEIRSNRYIQNEEGQLKKFPPDYIVDKSPTRIKTSSLEWAAMYGQTIIRFDYKKIAHKASVALQDCITQVQSNLSSFSFQIQGRINYLMHILKFFATGEEFNHMKDCYFQCLQSVVLHTDFDPSYFCEINQGDDIRFQQILQLWEEKNRISKTR